MGCANTRKVIIPISIIEEKSSLITPNFIRRNLKTEIFKNNGKIRTIKENIESLQANLYNMILNEENFCKYIEIEQEIEKENQRIFRYETHNIILKLHLETAAPGKYIRNAKAGSKNKSRNVFHSTRSSTGNLSRHKYDCKTTEVSSVYYMTRQSNISDDDFQVQNSILSISNIREIVS